MTESARTAAPRAGPPPPSSTPSAVTHQETQRLPARARWPTRPGNQGPSSAPPRPHARQPATAAACPRHQEPDRTLLIPGCTSCRWWLSAMASSIPTRRSGTHERMKQAPRSPMGRRGAVMGVSGYVRGVGSMSSASMGLVRWGRSTSSQVTPLSRRRPIDPKPFHPRSTKQRSAGWSRPNSR